MQSTSEPQTSVSFKCFLIAFVVENAIFLVLFFGASHIGLPKDYTISALIFAGMTVVSVTVFLSLSSSAPLSTPLRKIISWLQRPAVCYSLVLISLLCSLLAIYLLSAYGVSGRDYLLYIKALGIRVPNSLWSALLDTSGILSHRLFAILYLFITSILVQIPLLSSMENRERVTVKPFYKGILAIIFTSILSILGVVLSIQSGLITQKDTFSSFFNVLISFQEQFIPGNIVFNTVVFSLIAAVLLACIAGWRKKNPRTKTLFSPFFFAALYLSLPLLLPFFMLSGLLWAGFDIPAICLLWGTCYLLVTWWLREYIWMRRVTAAVAVVGMILLLNNLAGLFLPYPGMPLGTAGQNVNDSDFAYAPGEIPAEYAQRMTGLIHTTITPSKRVTIPFYKNFFLVFYGAPNYEFCDYRRAIQRGQGLCSQQAKALANLLARHGIPARVVFLDGHVVAAAQVAPPDGWWIYDANYDVTIPHDIDAIEADPASIRPYYREAGYTEENIDTLAGMYGREGNSLSAVILPGENLCISEDVLYLLKWLVPILMFLPYYVWGRKRAKIKDNIR